MTEADIKRGEHLFTTECGYTDTKHRANLVDKKVSEDILRKIEDGCSIETLEELLAGQFPICKYKTQITIHGLFPHLATERVGRYKNLVRNKNQSVGVRWTAIDHKKRADIFRLAYICDKWGIVENSQEFFLQRVEPVTTEAELTATLAAFQSTAKRIEAASNLFQGGVDIFKARSWGRLYLVLRVSVNSFYLKDFDALACVLCNRPSIEAIRAEVAAYDAAKAKERAERDRESAERAAAWKAAKEADEERKREFLKTFDWPYMVEYGTFKAYEGEFYAVVVHEDPHDLKSPFCVKYRKIRKFYGKFRAYECDEHGNITSRKGRDLMIGKYTGYRINVDGLE